MSYYRTQPKGLSLFGHRSKLAYEEVGGIFAYEDPAILFNNYSWIYIQKRLPKYEMIEFEGTLVDRPEDSEGVVVLPTREISRTPMIDWLASSGYVKAIILE